MRSLNRPGRAQALKALADTVAKLRKEIEDLQAGGGFPHDYSIGFTNALIFALHRLRGKPGDAKFYTRKTSIGELPRPMRFENSEEDHRELAQEIEYKRLVDDVLYGLEQLRGYKIPQGETLAEAGKWIALWKADLALQDFLKQQEDPNGKKLEPVPHDDVQESQAVDESRKGAAAGEDPNPTTGGD